MVWKNLLCNKPTNIEKCRKYCPVSSGCFFWSTSKSFLFKWNLLFRPWKTQNTQFYLSDCYIYITSLIHSRITNSVKVVCFKAFMHRSNLNLCSTACWGLCNSLQHFPDRQIMNEVSGTLVSFPKTTESKLNKLFFLTINLWKQSVLLT